jgi:excisionase family DNA binding protein
MIDETKLRNVLNAAVDLNTTRQTVYAWIAKGRLNSIEIDGTLYVQKDETFERIQQERQK